MTIQKSPEFFLNAEFRVARSLVEETQWIRSFHIGVTLRHSVVPFGDFGA